MKTYKERLPEIDKAIFKLGGEWPYDVKEKNSVMVTGGWSDLSEAVDTYFLSRSEFEARVEDWRRLHDWCDTKLSFKEFLELKPWVWVSAAEEEKFNWQLSLTDVEKKKPKQYEYMKEYLCSGEKPDLEDDILIQGEYRSIGIEMSEPVTAEVAAWDKISKFRIVDERYKPKSEDVYTNTCGIRACKDREDWERCGTDSSDFELSVTQTDSEIIEVNVLNKPKSDWFGRGDNPPAGTHCEVKHDGEFVKCFVVGLDADGEGLVCKVERKTERGSAVEYTPHYQCTFRPPPNERDELIENLKAGAYLDCINAFEGISMRQSTGEGLASAMIGYLYDLGWRPEEGK